MGIRSFRTGELFNGKRRKGGGRMEDIGN